MSTSWLHEAFDSESEMVDKSVLRPVFTHSDSGWSKKRIKTAGLLGLGLLHRGSIILARRFVHQTRLPRPVLSSATHSTQVSCPLLSEPGAVATGSYLQPNSLGMKDDVVS